MAQKLGHMNYAMRATVNYSGNKTIIKYRIINLFINENESGCGQPIGRFVNK